MNPIQGKPCGIAQGPSESCTIWQVFHNCCAPCTHILLLEAWFARSGMCAKFTPTASWGLSVVQSGQRHHVTDAAKGMRGSLCCAMAFDCFPTA